MTLNKIIWAAPLNIEVMATIQGSTYPYILLAQLTKCDNSKQTLQNLEDNSAQIYLPDWEFYLP